jgi:hypothetical protein
MHGNEDIIQWLIDNDEIVQDIIKKTNEQLKEVDKDYYCEAKEQQIEEIQRQVIDEAAYVLGLTQGDLCEIISIEMIRKVMEVT